MKNLAIVAVLILAVSVGVFAQGAKSGGIARQVAMGGSNAGTSLVLNPFIMDDPALMLVNPAYQAEYHDYGWANVAGGAVKGLSQGGGDIGDDGYGHQNAGIAFSLNNAWNVGAILSYDPSAINVVNSSLIPSIIQGRAPQTIPTVANVWEVVASNHTGSMDWGFGISYGWSNTDQSAQSPSNNFTSEASSSVWGFRAGIVAPFGSGNSFDASASLHLDKATDNLDNSTPAASSHYSASGTELQFNARAKFNVSSKFNFVPYGQFNTISAEPKEDTKTTGVTSTVGSNKMSVTAYQFGAGGEYRSQGFYFAGGLSWLSAKVKQEAAPATPAGGTAVASTTSSITYSALPVMNLGGEWWFCDWLAGRAGYYRSLGKINQKVEPPTGGTVAEANTTFPNSFIGIGAISGANYDGLVTMGLGLKFGGWALDATVSEEALRRGFGVIGAQDNINTFGYLTTSFNFAE